jgi:hypothetical protein
MTEFQNSVSFGQIINQFIDPAGSRYRIIFEPGPVFTKMDNLCRQSGSRAIAGDPHPAPIHRA